MVFDPNKFPRWVFICVLIFSQVSLEFSSASPQIEEKLSVRVVKGLFRSRRQACEHGAYEHDTRTCCLCAVGLRVKTHCLANQNDGQCESCDNGTYSSRATSQKSCEPCTSCTQPNANLEVAERCTRASNAKCRCKKDHYCSSGPETCRVCHPCKECGSEGVGVACNATNNTVCNAITEGGNDGIIPGIVIAILAISAILIGVAFWCCRKRILHSTRQRTSQTNGNATDVELQPLNDLQLHHVPDIATVLRWKDMQDVAMRSGMTAVDIDSCRRVDPTDSEEQTIRLLSKWMEREGKGGAQKLITHLRKSHKMEQAEKVAGILRSDSTAPSDAPV